MEREVAMILPNIIRLKSQAKCTAGLTGSRSKTGRLPVVSDHTWCQQDDRGNNQGADNQDDEQGDGDSLPVPLWGVAAHQLL